MRTKIQHSWATAVEVVGTFTKQALKASQGEEKWLKFFECVSTHFANYEKYKKLKSSEEKNYLKRLMKNLKVEEVLAAFSVSTDHLTREDKKDFYYFLIKLDIKNRVVNFERYYKNQIEEASEHYNELEKEYEGDETKDFVLVSARSLRILKKSYPNYFADTEEFLKYLRKVI